MWNHLKGWNRCNDCWLSYEKGIQHSNSLSCYKVGIPISSLNVPIEEFIDEIRKRDYIAKYGFFPFPINLMSKGVIILYFTNKDDMLKAIDELKSFVKGPNQRERLFFNNFVNVDWIEGFNYRRGCPEYDKKFGDWRKWSENH